VSLAFKKRYLPRAGKGGPITVCLSAFCLLLSVFEVIHFFLSAPVLWSEVQDSVVVRHCNENNFKQGPKNFSKGLVLFYLSPLLVMWHDDGHGLMIYILMMTMALVSMHVYVSKYSILTLLIMFPAHGRVQQHINATEDWSTMHDELELEC